MPLLLFLLESIDVGWVGGGAIGGFSIVTAVVVLWKRSEATNAALIDVHKQRANEAEARTKEITEVLHQTGEAMKSHTAAIQQHARAIEAHAESEVKMAEATAELAKASAKLKGTAT